MILLTVVLCICVVVIAVIVLPLHGAAQFLDHTHGLMAHGQALGHRVFTLEDVHVGAADGGGGDAH